MQIVFPRPLRIFLIVLIACTAASVGTAFVAEHFLHLGIPYSTVLLINPGFDLWYIKLMPNLHSYAFYPPNEPPSYLYPSAIAPFYLLFAHLPHPVEVFQWMVLAIAFIGAFLLGRSMVAHGLSKPAASTLLLLTVALSYPMWFEWMSCNMEIFVFAFIAPGMWLFLRRKYSGAAILFGIAAAMKIYPIVLLALFLPRRQFRMFLLGLLSTALVTAGTLAMLTPSIAYSFHGMLRGIALYSSISVEHLYLRATGYDHSPFNFPKLLLYAIQRRDLVHGALRIYLVIAAAAGVSAFVFRVRHLPVVNQVVFLVTVAVFLTPSSFDYTLMHLYVPWGLLAIYSLRKKRAVYPAALTAAMVCFAILLTPQTEVILHNVMLAGQFKAIVAAVLLYITLRYPFPGEFDNPDLARGLPLNAA